MFLFFFFFRKFGGTKIKIKKCQMIFTEKKKEVDSGKDFDFTCQIEIPNNIYEVFLSSLQKT